VGHLLQDAFGADGGSFFEPYPRTRAQRQEGLLTDGAGPHAVITGHLIAVIMEMTVVYGQAARGGAVGPGVDLGGELRRLLRRRRSCRIAVAGSSR
jgi:hypothetical protein